MPFVLQLIYVHACLIFFGFLCLILFFPIWGSGFCIFVACGIGC